MKIDRASVDNDRIGFDGAESDEPELDSGVKQMDLFDSLEEDPFSDGTQPGFRLKRLEVYNWGTFNNQIWCLNLDGQNALLTGDIGSGKSTLVDAISTLLVGNRVNYNKAAGAEKQERNLRSYVLGHYKTERSDTTGIAKPVALRDHNSYSVILGVFYNADFHQSITLAQVFYIKDHAAPPARFYVGAEKELSIARDFSNFGTDISGLRKVLKKSDAEIFDTYPPYKAWFCRRFRIEHDQALELFHQTVSMKSVGNLTDFVRNHMLEPPNVTPRLEALIQHFEDLTSAHNAVLKAERQISLLTPLVENCHRRASFNQERQKFVQCRDGLKVYFSTLKKTLLEKKLENLSQERTRLNKSIEKIDIDLREKRSSISDVKNSIADNGGDRLERLSIDIQRLTSEFERRRDKEKWYSTLIGALDMKSPTDAMEFAQVTSTLEGQAAASREEDANLQNKHTETAVELKQCREEHEELSTEIASLKSRKSNILASQLKMRQSLCEALDLDEEVMPFVGELLQVRESEKDWEGAAERVMRNFGLSLLVPDKEYSRVSDWVDRTHLNGRLVYFRVRESVQPSRPPSQINSLANKLDIKPDSPYFDWLEREVTHRFDISCCRTGEEFRRSDKAITMAGQLKMSGERHEKDDRFRIDDRSRFVLGWTNQAKIDVLELKERTLQSRIADLATSISKLKEERSILQNRLSSFMKLEEYRDFRDIDWRSVALEIQELEEEKRELETASDVLKQLTERLKGLENEFATLNSLVQEKIGKRGRLDGDIERTESDLEEANSWIESSESLTPELMDALDAVRQEAVGEQQITLDSCSKREQDCRAWLQNKIDSVDKRLSNLNSKIIEAMKEYTTLFPLETQEVDVSIDASDEFEKMLIALNADDLPRFKSRFKELLNENTIREIVYFQSQLAREREMINEKISRINEALSKIDYNPNRFIVLEAQISLDAEIRDFQTELRACTEGTLVGSDDSQYSEEKFLQVKSIIERFKGREGQTDQDRRWTSKVTDVRNWFSFAASERWREGGDEFEHYSDSGGKSGGQKEKLAYTILAASLAYQFGLEWVAGRSRSFRFVVIDEAFGRGSDDSARYGLELFKQLKLQLLVATPLQKVDIIEPYVSSVGFVQNEQGNASKLRNITIEEYRTERELSAG